MFVVKPEEVGSRMNECSANTDWIQSWPIEKYIEIVWLYTENEQGLNYKPDITSWVELLRYWKEEMRSLKNKREYILYGILKNWKQWYKDKEEGIVQKVGCNLVFLKFLWLTTFYFFCMLWIIIFLIPKGNKQDGYLCSHQI